MHVEIGLDLPDHPKTIRLETLLKISNFAAVTHLVFFWIWCGRYAEDGCLDEYIPEEIAKGARWAGDAKTFYDAMVTAGWITKTKKKMTQTTTVHAWEKHYGRLLIAKRKHAERMKKYRVTRAQMCASRDSHVLADRKGKDRNGYDMRGEEVGAALSSPPSATPAFLSIPLTHRNGEPEEYAITESQVAEWESIFPGMDVRQSLRSCLLWNQSNPGKRKTAKGILRHVTGWLSDDQDRGKFRKQQTPTLSAKPDNSIRREHEALERDRREHPEKYLNEAEGRQAEASLLSVIGKGPHRADTS